MTIEKPQDSAAPTGAASALSAGLGRLYAPGSPDAVAHGCTCPTMDNGNGAGCGYTSELTPGEPLYWFDFGCPLHGQNKSIAPETRCYKMPNVELTGAKPQAERPS